MGVYDRDYMRGPEGVPGGRRRWLGTAILGGLVVVAAGCFLQRGFQFPPPWDRDGDDEGPKPKLLEVRPVDLGQFEVVSGEVAVSDPGYHPDEAQRGASAKKVGNVARGSWQARLIRHVIDRPDEVRCGELLAFLAASPLPEDPAWQKIHPGIGVDSGQAGFFDWRHFRSAAVVPADHPWKARMLAPDDPWYALCCDVTLQGDGGVIPYGVVASSGWGDGGYPLYALRDDKGTLTALRLVFISLDEYEPAEKKEAELPAAGGEERR
jgi:Protein of unknown function (DUF4241)